MAFKLPSLNGRVSSDKSLNREGLPLFGWHHSNDKEDAIGRGSFGGLVFVATAANNEKVVIMKLISDEDHEKRLFLKEAKILQGVRSEHVEKFKAACLEPCAIMLEYLCFDFAPFSVSKKVSSLDKFLEFIHVNAAVEQFSFQQKIARDTATGLAHLHGLGIVHRDIKPANALVSNQHYCAFEDRQDLENVFKDHQ